MCFRFVILTSIVLKIEIVLQIVQGVELNCTVNHVEALQDNTEQYTPKDYYTSPSFNMCCNT